MNSVVELISLLRSLNVKIWVDGENLRLSAPANTITPELRQNLTRYKTELIAFLREAAQPVTGDQAIKPLRPRPVHVPLSFSQEQLWFLAQMQPESPMYNVPQAFRLRGPLDFSILQNSLAQVIARHESLRTIFTSQNGLPVQVVLPYTGFSLQRIQAGDWQAWLKTETNCPFDLVRGPLFRSALLEIGPDEHILFINTHHIATDGWSDSLFLREVSTCYAATLENKTPLLPTLPIQYCDFAAWQRELLQGKMISNQVNYWRKQFQDVSTQLEIPTDFSRPATQTFRGKSHESPIPPGLLEKIKVFSNLKGVTPFMTLLAAFDVLLYRYSGQDKFTIGTPVANRTRAETESVIGMFINTITLRADMGKDIIFLNLLEKVRETCLEAYAHQDVPFEKLVSELKLPRDMSRNPLFQIMFVLQNTPASELILPNIQVEELPIPTETSKFDFTFYITQSTRGDILKIQYCTDLFSEKTIQGMARHYLRLLESILAAPEQKITELPLLTEEELHQLLAEWNATRVEFPPERCIHTLFESQVERTPSALAAVFEEQTISYWHLNEKANQLAHYLRAIGVGPDKCVGILLDRSLEVIVALIATLKAGGAYVPLDPSLPAGRIGDILKEAQPLMVLTQAAFENLVPGDVPSLKLDAQWPELARYPASNPTALAQPANLAYILFTSGSTGHPKGVAIEHRQLYNYLNSIVPRLALPEGAQYALVSTFAADLGNTVIFPALCGGGTLHIISYLRALSPVGLAEYFSHHPIDCLKIVPSHLKALLNTVNQAGILPRQCLVLGGEALDWEFVNFIRQAAPGCRIINHYGPTETTVGVLTYPILQKEIPQTGNVPLGRPLDNTKLYVLDQHGQLVPQGIPGELYIGGSSVARGYLNRPELTIERFCPNQFEPDPDARLYKTGDLVRYLADGNIEFLGRLDDQVKIRGFRIELAEIQATLNQHPAVRASVVIVREDVPGDKRLVAYVVLAQPNDPQILVQLREHIKAKLPHYMVPGAFVFLVQLPLTPNGKIDRKALPQPDSAPISSVEFVAPQTPTEKILADILANLLGVQQVGRHDNFFELGGDSITSLQFISRAQAKGLGLTPRQVFEAQTIDALAQIAQPSSPIRDDPGLVLGQVPLTPIQHYFFEHHSISPHRYNQFVVVKVARKIELRLLSQAIGYLIKHHDALRLRFERSERGWQQELAKIESPGDLITQVDLSGLSPTLQLGKFEIINAELQSSLNLKTGPLMRVALFDYGPDQSQDLLIVIHHLIVDFISWQVLVSDLWAVYEQVAQNQTPKLPGKSSSFKAWAEWLAMYAYDEKLLAELPHWLEIGRQPIKPIPVETPGSHNRNSGADRIEIVFSKLETDALLWDVPAVYHTQPHDILLTALLQTFSAWTGEPNLLFTLQNYERASETIDLSRTVGWITSLFPVYLRLDADDNDSIIKSVKEQLRQIPHKGMGYGILRYLNHETAQQLAELPQGEVCFSYYGRMKNFAIQTTGSKWAEAEHLNYLFRISAVIVTDQLILSCLYSRNLYSRKTVEKLAQDFVQALNRLIVHCQSPQAGGYTPSDFPLAKITQSQLDALVGVGRDVVELYPLSPLQNVMLFQSTLAPQSGIYFNQNSFQLIGTLDVPRYKAAWQEVVNRHTILRTSFAWQALSAPVQIVHKKVSLNWDELDWRKIPPGEQPARFQQLLAYERQQDFDLTKVPHHRFTLIRVDEDKYWFVWHCHHMLKDGWSSQIIIREVWDLYENPTTILQPALPYQDYIAWLSSQDIGKAEAYWREQLSGISGPTPMPGQSAWKNADARTYTKVSISLPRPLTSTLQAVTQRQRLTLNTLCQGAWALVLHELSGEDDIVFGVTVSGRSAPLPQIETRVGLFMNTLPLRVKLIPDQPWDQALQTIMQEQNMLEQYAYTPISQIQSWIGLQPDQMLFFSHVRFQNYPSQELNTSTNQRLKIEDFISFDWWHYPLNLIIIPGAELQLVINYAVNSFDPTLIQQMLEKLAIILSRFAHIPPGEKITSLIPNIPGQTIDDHS